MKNGRVKSTPQAAATGTGVQDFPKLALYDKHSREIWAVAYARWMNADTAMDVTQETFLRLWKQ